MSARRVGTHQFNTGRDQPINLRLDRKSWVFAMYPLPYLGAGARRGAAVARTVYPCPRPRRRRRPGRRRRSVVFTTDRDAP